MNGVLSCGYAFVEQLVQTHMPQTDGDEKSLCGANQSEMKRER